jgi:hypothetical protein
VEVKSFDNTLIFDDLGNCDHLHWEKLEFVGIKFCLNTFFKAEKICTASDKQLQISPSSDHGEDPNINRGRPKNQKQAWMAGIFIES